MKKIIFIFIIIPVSLFSQENKVNIHSPENIRRFADHLFCEKDYLRSVLEYENYLSNVNDDTIKFKLGLAYRYLEEYDKSAEIFKSIFPKLNSQQEYYNSLFRNNHESFRVAYLSSAADMQAASPAKKLFLFSYFFTKSNIPSEKEYEETFNSDKRVMEFYYKKLNPAYKSRITAGILSAFIPGAGKIYTEQYGDGITAFIVTGILSYLSYTNFKAAHNFRGWMFAGLSALFYAGNIYGSVASARIYNAGVKINFENDLKFFLNNQNYFMPEYNFCR